MSLWNKLFGSGSKAKPPKNSKEKANQEGKTTDKASPVGMIKIPAGSFMMGSLDVVGAPDEYIADEHPQHEVTLDSFYMDVTEVTQGDYEKLMRVNPSSFKGELNRPVEYVTWFDAVLYCNARSKRDGLDSVYSYTSIDGRAGNGCTELEGLEEDFSRNGYRLPTEAEWEYACRAGTKTHYYWGDGIVGDYCWYKENSKNETHPVGGKKPNAWGLNDMSGNVWEWCNDWYGSYSATSETTNPTGPTSGRYRVLRGGSWHVNFDYLRSAARNYNDTHYRYGNLGFRCVRR
jgi:formylglycine-generating enzyme required for sulfatase activity